MQHIDASVSKVTYGTNDGAWALSVNGLTAESIVYSVGVGKDVTFDLELIDRHGCRVHAFDPTSISCTYIAGRRLPAAFVFHPLGLAAYDGEATFRLPPGHVTSFSMHPEISGDRDHKGQVATLATLMRNLGHARIDLLKIDIEGGEYDIIQDLCDAAPRIGQLLIEFHARLIPGKGTSYTEDAIAKLKAAGFHLFHTSERGLEFSFLGPTAR